MNVKKLSVWAIALLCLTTLVSAQTVIYVSPAGNDNNNGSASAPLLTMETAVSRVQENVETIIYAEENATFNIAKLDLLSNKKVTIIGRNTTFIAHAKPGYNKGEGGRILRAVTNCDLTVKGIIFRNGRQVGYSPGGAVYFAGNVLTIDSCQFYGNEAGSAGGGVAGRGKTVIVRNSYFEDNYTIGGGSRGGAIAQIGLGDGTMGCSLTVENCTFFNNRLGSADGSGGGQGSVIGIWDGGVESPYSNLDLLEVVNCTFVGNTSVTPYQAAIDVSDAQSTTKTYLVNNTFYNNDGALRIGSLYTPNIYLINNVIFAKKAGIFGNESVNADGREPVVAYNNIIVGDEDGVNQWMDDPCFNAEKATYKNIVSTTAQYPLSNVALSTVLSEAFVPYLAITSESSPLVDAGLDHSTSVTGRDLIPAGDVRGGATRNTKDIGAYEWNAIANGIFNPLVIESKGFEIVRTSGGLEVKNISGKSALLTIYDLAGRKIYASSVQQSVLIGKEELKRGIVIFSLDNGLDTFVEKVWVY
jgi:hypothetical protein